MYLYSLWSGRTACIIQMACMFVCVLVFIIKSSEINLIVFTFSFIFWYVCTNSVPKWSSWDEERFILSFFFWTCFCLFGLFFPFLYGKMFVTSIHVAALRGLFFLKHLLFSESIKSYNLLFIWSTFLFSGSSFGFHRL